MSPADATPRAPLGAAVAVVIVVLAMAALVSTRAGVLGALATTGIALGVVAGPALVFASRERRRVSAGAVRSTAPRPPGGKSDRSPAAYQPCACCSPEGLHETRLV